MDSFNLFGMETDYGIWWGSLVLLFLPLISRLWWDWRTIKKLKKEVNHADHTIVTAFIMFTISFLVWKIEPVRFMFQPFLFSWGIFWFFFDPVLNLLLGKNWYYIDEDVYREVPKGQKRGPFARIEAWYYQLGVWNTLFIRAWWLLFTMSTYFFWSLIVS